MHWAYASGATLVRSTQSSVEKLSLMTKLITTPLLVNVQLALRRADSEMQ